MTQLSIIIPVKNDALNLKACLQSINTARSEHLVYEVLVIDNGSSDETVAIAIDALAAVHEVPDVTVAGLRNFGAQIAKGDLLAFIDADCTVEPDWFESLIPYLENQAVKVFGCPPGIPSKPTWVQECWYQIRRKGEISNPVVVVEWLESMNLFVRRDVFNAVEGFNVQLVTCEDYDLCTRLKQYGDIVSDARIQTIHHGEAETVRRFYEKERWRGVSNIEGFRQHDYALNELPSILFPLVQLLSIVAIGVALMVSIFGDTSLWICLLVVTVWQVPLLVTAFRKGHKEHRVRQGFGLWVLINVYLTARGQSLFMSAAWR